LKFSLPAQWRSIFSVAKDQPKESCRAKVSRNEATRIREAPQQPSDANAVGPHGNAHLLTAQKSDCRTNAANGWAVRKIILKPVTELFLGAATGANEDE
jgi:hypothetical protein